MQSLDKFYDISNYVLKYIEKTLENGSYIPKGAKFYLTSKGLKKSLELYYTEEQLNQYLELHEDKEIIYANEYENEFVGEYQYYKLRKSDEIHKNPKPIDKETYLEYYDEISNEMEERERTAKELKELYNENYCL